MTNIGIVGYGVVGKALHNLFINAMIYDKFNDYNTKDDINQCDIVFICAPTPVGENGECDTTAVEECVEWIKAPIIVIKSTVPPGTTNTLAQLTSKNILHNPEFLKENTSNADVFKEGRIIIGTPLRNKSSAYKVIREYQKVLGADTKYFVTHSDVSELVKYAGNSFLATKVAFFNQLYDLCKMMKINYDEVRELVLTDERIGRSHTIVTEERGFGGSCFPKDVQAMIDFSLGEMSIVEEAWRYNQRIRGKTQSVSKQLD